MSKVYVHDLDSYITTNTHLTTPLDEVLLKAWCNIIPDITPTKDHYKAIGNSKFNITSTLRKLISEQREIENYNKIEREYYL